MIYLDNAATSFPKPRRVLDAMTATYAEIGVSPGRGSYDLAARAERFVADVRRQLSEFFGADDPRRVVFANNATDALNTIIQGLIEPGCHVISSRLEHNSVLRPLHELRTRGLIEFTLLPFDRDGFIDPAELSQHVKPATKLVILNHVSNVLGTIQPVAEVGQRCAEMGLTLVLDVSQSAGLVPISLPDMQVDAVAFTGHKSLLGPTGIGGLVIRDGLDVKPSRFGGTGFDSLSPLHPEEYPYRLEAGTLNLLGIIGLSEGLGYIADEGVAALHDRELRLSTLLRDSLADLDGVKLYCAEDLTNHVGLFSCNIEGLDPEDFASILDGDFDIATRSGLHCAPFVHQDMGTDPRGAVRFSVGPFTTQDDIEAVAGAVRAIVSG